MRKQIVKMECKDTFVNMLIQNNCAGKGEERQKRDLQYSGEYIHDFQGSDTVLTMGPLMVAVNDVLLDAIPVVAQEGKFECYSINRER